MELKRNTTICFFGDSITAKGLWIKDIWENMKEHTKKLFNCGIPGDSAVSAKSRIYETCLIHAPDYVTVMFGMNDIGRHLYLDDANEQAREERIKTYTQSIEKIINVITACGAMPILLTPTPYDEESDVPTKNLKCNAGIDKCAESVRLLAQKYALPLVDFNNIFKSKRNNKSIIGSDRVHPNDEGHKLMAESFLNAFGIHVSQKEETMQNCNRYKIEQELINILFVDYNMLLEKLKGEFVPLDTKKQMCFEIMRSISDNEPNVDDYIKMCCQNYIENADKVPELRKKLIQLTLETDNYDLKI